MAFYWGHQGVNGASPTLYSPLELLKYKDTYYEDFACRKKSDSPSEYTGLVQTVGIRSCYPNYHFLDRISSRYSLHYVLSGKGYVGDRKVSEGDVIFFDRNQIHNFSTDNTEPCRYAWITFKGPMCKQLLLTAGLHQNTIFKTENLTQIKIIFNDMLYTEHAGQQPDLFFDSCLYKLLSYTTAPHTDTAQNDTSTKKRNSAEGHIERALIYIKAHHKERDFQIESIGPAIGLNDVYFRKLFKQRLGISPKQYLIKYRIEAATTLLHSSSYSITEIATMVGFHDYRNFFETFRRHTGQAPSEIRTGASRLADKTPETDTDKKHS